MLELRPSNFVQSRTAPQQIHQFLDPRHVRWGIKLSQPRLMLTFLIFLENGFVRNWFVYDLLEIMTLTIKIFRSSIILNVTAMPFWTLTQVFCFYLIIDLKPRKLLLYSWLNISLIFGKCFYFLFHNLFWENASFCVHSAFFHASIHAQPAHCCMGLIYNTYPQPNLYMYGSIGRRMRMHDWSYDTWIPMPETENLNYSSHIFELWFLYQANV